MSDKMTLYCTFCGKSQHEVMCLIAGPTVFICDLCVEICGDIAFDHRVARAIERLQPAVRWAMDNPAEVLELRNTASGMSASGQDPQGLEAKPASPTAESGDAQ